MARPWAIHLPIRLPARGANTTSQDEMLDVVIRSTPAANADIRMISTAAINMTTTKDIMESCWEADAPYADVVEDCQILGLRIPTEAEYKKHCAMSESELQDWYDEHGDVDEQGAFDAGGHFYAQRITFEDEE